MCGSGCAGARLLNPGGRPCRACHAPKWCFQQTMHASVVRMHGGKRRWDCAVADCGPPRWRGAAPPAAQGRSGHLAASCVRHRHPCDIPPRLEHGRAVLPPPGLHLPAVSSQDGTVRCRGEPPGPHRLPSAAPPATSGCRQGLPQRADHRARLPCSGGSSEPGGSGSPARDLWGWGACDLDPFRRERGVQEPRRLLRAPRPAQTRWQSPAGGWQRRRHAQGRAQAGDSGRQGFGAAPPARRSR